MNVKEDETYARHLGAFIILHEMRAIFAEMPPRIVALLSGSDV